MYLTPDIPSTQDKCCETGSCQVHHWCTNCPKLGRWFQHETLVEWCWCLPSYGHLHLRCRFLHTEVGTCHEISGCQAHAFCSSGIDPPVEELNSFCSFGIVVRCTTLWDSDITFVRFHGNGSGCVILNLKSFPRSIGRIDLGQRCVIIRKLLLLVRRGTINT